MKTVSKSQEFYSMHHIEKLDNLLYGYLPTLNLPEVQFSELVAYIQMLYIDALTDAFDTGKDHGYDIGFDKGYKTRCEEETNK